MTNVRIAVLIAALGATLLVAVVGCTSDPPTSLGRALVTTRVDTVLAPLALRDFADFGQQLVSDPDRPLLVQDHLYLGEQEGMASVVLVNYDFSGFTDSTSIGDNEEVTPDLVTTQNISSVKVRVLVPCFYRDYSCDDEQDPGLRKYYEIFQLQDPFAEDAAWPGPIPPFDPSRLNDDAAYEDDRDNGFAASVEVTIYPEDFVAWIQNRETASRVGIMIREGVGLEPVDPGIKGFAAKDNRFARSRVQCDCDSLDVRFIGPTLRVTFANDVELDNRQWNIDPAEDVSTFHQLDEPPATDEAIVLRTHLRSYPALRFDLSRVPPNALVNAAVLVVWNDTTRAFGNGQNVVASEYDTLAFGPVLHEITLSQLDGAIDYTTRVTGPWFPETDTRMNIVVTETVQRHVNRVEGMMPSFVLTAGESFLAGSASGSDYYLSQFRYFGLAAADTTLRPRLEITYSVLNELGEAGDE